MEGQAEVDSASASGQRLFNVQNIYGTPQIPRKRPCLQVRPRRMTLIDLRNVSLSEEDVPHRKSSSGTVRSEGGLPASQLYPKHGILPIYDSTDSLDSRRSSNSMKIRRIPSLLEGSTRFPKLEECAHFHYDAVELGPIEVHLCEDDRENYHHNDEEVIEDTFLLRVKSNEKSWNIRRTFSNFRSLDKQLHRCIFDRKFSQLVELQRQDEEKENNDLRRILRHYLERFSELAGSMLNCGSVLNWLELDNRGNRLLAVDDSGINTPAIAAAHAIKRYNAQAVDEISLEVGDIVSVIDMPPAEDTIWWRGKRGFEVGFFPGECVEVIGDKVPNSMATRILRRAASKKPLIRRHGKLMSFLRTFFSTRPARNQLKQSGIVKERIFGCDLGEHLLNSGHDVPLVLKCCAEVIEKHGIVDGIYRLSGITSNIQKLRLAFDEDGVPDLCDDCYLQDIHSISSLLKMYLRELPNPLLTYQLYDKFADAVRDEDNKLLRIHDVVQQLPPPHYRTTEYLMKHLARVAAHGHETGMHSKNLAIVWAPNLLRSKELEMGGGAAALQGVGIQAVVTECLICYSDIIFSDKMPSYSSPELQKAHKKPRPKSLAISTPTRLLTLEEARERAFVGGLIPVSQKFIDVGGGPDSLPAKYHTVIDLPGYKKKNVSTKTKKSPVSGWKSIFSKPRSGSIKKARKSSIQDNLNIAPVQGKALTEEDVHNWKKRLRSAKSAESLLSLASSNRGNGGRMTKAPDNTMVLNVYKEERPHHKRSLSSDATAILSHHSHNPIFLTSGREMPIDVDTSVVPHVMEDAEMSPRKSRPMRREDPGKGSFIRGDSSRLPLHHRRTPSAPNTPNQDRSGNRSGQVSNDHKTLSQPTLESPSQVQRRQVYAYIQSSEESLDGDHVELKTNQAKYRKSSEELAPQKRSARTPPKGRKKSKGNSPEKSSRSPSSKEEVKDQKDALKGAAANEKFFYSKTHDYAEIMSDEESGITRDSSFRKSDILCSPCDMRDFMEHIDNKFAKHKQSGSYVDDSPEKKDRLSNGSHNSWQTNEQFNRRSCDYAQVNKNQQNGSRTSPIVAGLNSDIRRQNDNKTTTSSPSANRETMDENSQMQTSSSKNKMSKCLSVPSDIAKSLENINVGSNMDMFSSVTISELSQSVDSFNHSFNHEERRFVKDPRRRRSASCDSLTAADSPMCRTLREINQQIDKAFQENVDRALKREGEGYQRHEHNESNLTSFPLSESYPSAVGKKSNTYRHNSYEYLPGTQTLLSEEQSQMSQENPTFLSSIPLDLFENKDTEISSNPSKLKKSVSTDEYTGQSNGKLPHSSSDTSSNTVAGIYRRHNSSSSDSSAEMPKINVYQEPHDLPSLHNQYVISGEAMFPTDQIGISNPQLFSQQSSYDNDSLMWRNSSASDGPDYARINKSRASPNQQTKYYLGDDAITNTQDFLRQNKSNPNLYVQSYDRQTDNSPVYCQIERFGSQTLSSPTTFGPSPKPSPRSSSRNLQPIPQQQTVSHHGSDQSLLPQSISPVADGWQTPRTFRRSDEKNMFSQQTVTSLSHSLNVSSDDMTRNQMHASTSLPEVHVHQDTLTEQKPTIKKSTTASELMDTIIQQELDSCLNTNSTAMYQPVPKPRKTISESRPEEEGDGRMTIEDIKQAHKTVKEGEKMLQILDTSNAGKKLDAVLMEHMDIVSKPGKRNESPTNIKESYMSQSPLTVKVETNRMTIEDIKQAHNTVKQGERMLQMFDSTNAGQRLDHIVQEHMKKTADDQNWEMKHQWNIADQATHPQNWRLSDPKQEKDTSIVFDVEQQFEQFQDSQFQPQYINPQISSQQQDPFANNQRVSPCSAPLKKQAEVPPENEHRMTLEDIKQAHKTVRQGEKMLRMLDSSNAGQKMEDLVREHQMDSSPQVRKAYSPRENLTRSWGKDETTAYKGFTDSNVPMATNDTQVTRPESGGVRSKVTTNNQSESDRMTLDDIKRAHKTVKDGEKMLQKLDSSNAGKKLEDVMFEQIDIKLPSSHNSLSFEDTKEHDYSVIERPSKMSHSYTDSNSVHTNHPPMSSSWSGSGHSTSSSQKKNSDNTILIPADCLPATVIESRCEKTAPNPIGQITESQILHVESFGDVDQEEFESSINRGKALMIADKDQIDKKILPTSEAGTKNTSMDCRILPGQPIAVCRASDISNVNLPHGDILRAPSFISSGVSKSPDNFPPPKMRTSPKAGSSDVPPPHQEVIEVTRASVRKIKTGSKDIEDNGSNLPQNISEKKKGFHSRRIPHPPRQLAECIDDTSDSLTPEFSSTGPSDADPSGLSSTDDDVFSDVNDVLRSKGARRLIEDRDFDFMASLGKMEKVSSDSVKIPPKIIDEMVSSRSSLDESLLTLAAERHDIFGPETEEEPGFNTGSLRVKRSQKLKSLVELFESVSDNNDSDSSSPSARPKDRRHLTSSQPSILTHSEEASSKYDTDDESTPSRVRTNSFRHRSRSRSRDRAKKSGGIGSDKENRLQSRSPTPNRKSTVDHPKEVSFPPPSHSSPSDSSSDYRSRKQKTKLEKYSSMGKPPKYRSSSRNRTQSESSTSESEGSLCLDQSRVHHRLAECEVILRDQNRTELKGRESGVRSSVEELIPERCDLQRRGSIKELREFFECKKSEPEQEESAPSPVIQPKSGRDRIKSVSPSFREQTNRSSAASTSAMRYSLELPSSSILSHTEGVLKPHALRLGPKPFYGSKK